MAKRPPPPPPRAKRPIMLRPCFEQDLQWVQLIYAHHVLTGTGTFETEPPSLDEMTTRWTRVVGKGWPFLVASDGRDPSRIHGFAYAQQFRDRAAYAHTFEDSVYVSHTAQGAGIGATLLAGVVSELSQIGARQVIAVIGDSANEASIRTHAKLGFRRVGVLAGVGYKFNRWLDVVMMQRPISPPKPLPEA